MAKTRTRYTHEEWLAEAKRRFGADPLKWKFVCPICKHVASVQDWKDAGAGEGEVAFSCVGRHIEGSRKAFGGEGPGPCDYTNGGLFNLAPVEVVFQEGGSGRPTFDFAPVTPEGSVSP